MTEWNLAEVWPEWKIEKQIGRGTFGAVYQAVRQSNELTSCAAIKVISIPQDPYELESLRSDGLDLQATRTYLKRIVDDFVNEIRLMESFKGIQNIVSIEDYKVIEKTDALGWDIYIRMELLTPFSTYVCDRTLTEQDVIRLGCDICTALDICGRRNIIHRDIKPENIFVNSFGSFKLGDFGTARKMESLTGGLSQKGTYNYMAPEVISGNPYDARVDVYSLGLVLYRLMNRNRLPFLSEKQLLSPSERRAAFDRRIRGEALPAPCDASSAMAQVILKACSFDPKDRYANAVQFRQALLGVDSAQAEPAPVITPVPGEVPAEKAPEKKERKPKEKKSGMSLSAPAMSIDAPSFKISTPEKSGKKSFFSVLISCLVIAALIVGCIFLVRFIYPYIHDLTCNIGLQSEYTPCITVNTLPDKTRYEVGEYLDTEGMTVKLNHPDGTTEIIDSGFKCSPDGFTQAGTTTINVSYDGYVGTSFVVEVVEVVEIIGIELLSPPEKTIYVAGEYLDTRGLILEANYSDGTSKIITEEFFCMPEGLFEEGTVDVSVSYMGFVDTFRVEVVSSTQQNDPEFSFENFSVEMAGWANELTGEGYNQDGSYVSYCLWIDFDYPESLRNRYVETISCSWDKVINGSGVTEKDISFQASKDGETFMDFGIYESQNSITGNERYVFMLLLPDDPSIEGPQFVTIGAGGSYKTITFDLIYLGDYETGLGWSVTNICYD